MGAAGAAPLRGAASRARVGAGSGHGPFKPAAGTSGRVPRGRAAPRGGGEGAAPVRALTAANKVPGPRRGRSRPDTHRGSPGAPAPAPALGSRGGGGGLRLALATAGSGSARALRRPCRPSSLGPGRRLARRFHLSSFLFFARGSLRERSFCSLPSTPSRKPVLTVQSVRRFLEPRSPNPRTSSRGF
ncbi:uncharacterized protein LOC134476581 isoform X1 [Cavia porcellus]|uniref:uncharacterized protein LOC134476581 isoform X1 n=1 Tax=Cavia porcellus TaxID=10141 RepID=UPI002FE36361